MPTPPPRTPEQRAAAAAKAVRARAVRAQLRRDLTAGRLTLAEAFAAATPDHDDHDDHDDDEDHDHDPTADDEAVAAVGAMRVEQLLESLPGVGERRTDTVLTALAIPVGRRVRGLGARQRADLLARLGTPGRLPGVLSPARLTVLSGPSGVGKGTVVREIRGSEVDIWISVSCTTRRPRPGETDGVEYFFRTEAEFEDLVAAGEMLEWARFAGNLYGTPRAPVQERLAAGVPVLLEIDLQGARQVRAAMPEARLVFLAPPDVDELDRRLTARGTEDDDTLAARRAIAEVELAAAQEFDTVVVNDDIGRAAAELVRLVSSA